MSSCSIRPLSLPVGDSISSKIKELWNLASSGRHGFYPLPEGMLQERIFSDPRFAPHRFLLAYADGGLVGWLHYDVVLEPYYPPAASIEAVVVDPAFQGRGIATALLRTALEAIEAEGISLVDALGAFPYSAYYSTVACGSERSGPFLTETALLRLFERAGFVRGRVSLVMENTLDAVPAPERIEPNLMVSVMSRENDATWLDYVFRGWSLKNHILHRANGMVCSRAIFGRMEGVSDHTKTERYALFGVQTPPLLRGRGWAGENLRRLLPRLRASGVQTVELHVYEDNTPAVRLYTSLGFREIARTIILRRQG